MNALRRFSPIFLAVFFAVTFFGSCQKKPLEWDIDAHAPLFKTDLSISNLLTDSMLAVNDDHSLRFVWQRELFSLSTKNIAEIPDSLFEFHLPVSGAMLVAPGTLCFLKNEEQRLKISPMELLELRVNSGSFALNIINPFDQPLVLQYRIPAATHDGIPFVKSLQVPAGTAENKPFQVDISLADYVFDLRGKEGNSHNRFMMTMTANIGPAAPDSARRVGTEFLIQFKFKDLDIAYGRGYFGHAQTHFGPETQTFSFFDIVEEGVLELSRARAVLSISNGVGADLQFKLRNLTAKNSRTNREISFQSGILNRYFNLTRASETGNPNAPVLPATLDIDVSNSNILELFTIFPDQLTYEAELNFNPLSNISAGNDFLYRDAPLSAAVSLDIPLAFSAQNLTLATTVPYTFGDDFDGLNALTLYLIADNSYPYSADIQAVIVDEEGTPLLPLLTENRTILPAFYHGEGNTEPRRSIIECHLSADDLNLLRKNRNIRLQAVFNTIDNQQVTLYEQYKLSLKMTAHINYNISTNLTDIDL